jgi:hypothetical protein
MAVPVRDGHITDAEYKELVDVLFSEPKFEYDDVVVAERTNSYSNPCELRERLNALVEGRITAARGGHRYISNRADLVDHLSNRPEVRLRLRRTVSPGVDDWHYQ